MLPQVIIVLWKVLQLIKTSNHLFVINEKDPRMILGYNNLTEIWRKTIDYASDISDIYYEDSTNSFWLISDESQKILKILPQQVICLKNGKFLLQKVKE